MPFIDLAVIAYGSLLALTIAARPRYRTLAGLLLVSAAALGASYGWLGGAKERSQAPALASQAIEALHAQPWPTAPSDLARLVASFRALRDRTDEAAARFAYARAIERSIADEPPLAFSTVGQGLAWIRSLPPHNEQSSEWREIERIRQQAISRLIDVRFADTSDGWPASLDKPYGLRPGSRLVAPGVWAVDSGVSGRLVILQYALQIRNRGQGRIVQADVDYREALPSEPEPSSASPHTRDRGAGRLRIYCSVHVVDLDAGASSYSKCAVESSPLDTPEAARQLEHLAQLREGAITLEPMTGGSFEYTLAHAPQAEPLDRARADDFAQARQLDASRIRDQGRLRGRIREWLIALAVLGIGYALPGIRRRPIGIIGTVALAVLGAVTAVASTFAYFRAQGMDAGWLPVISSFVSLFYEVVFVGGLLLANLVLHQRNAPRLTNHGAQA
jgi:hypothetical protein